MPASGRIFGLCCALALTLLAQSACGQNITREEMLKIAESYLSHSWIAKPANVRHGKNAQGIDIQTPDRAGGNGQPAEDCWLVNETNTGMPYKWGGFDSLESFDRGIRAGKAAGDVYTAEKRRLGGAAVSGDAVGIDCSGFISRCWKLPRKHSTSMLKDVSKKLASPADLKPRDIMNMAEGHVLLFVRWTNLEHTRALFYEASPFSKTLASERDVAEMSGYQPLRYRGLTE